MKFTWWMYYIARRRAFKREYDAFCDHHGAFRGPNAWIECLRFSARLNSRYLRERKKR